MRAQERPTNGIQDTPTWNEKKQFSVTEAKQIGESLGILWDSFDIEHFMAGLNIELQLGGLDSAREATFDELALAGEKVLEQLTESPDHYSRLPSKEFAGADALSS